MLRVDALQAVYKELESCVVVTIMGAVAAELQGIGHLNLVASPYAEPPGLPRLRLAGRFYRFNHN